MLAKAYSPCNVTAWGTCLLRIRSMPFVTSAGINGGDCGQNHRGRDSGGSAGPERHGRDQREVVGQRCANTWLIEAGLEVRFLVSGLQGAAGPERRTPLCSCLWRFVEGFVDLDFCFFFWQKRTEPTISFSVVPHFFRVLTCITCVQAILPHEAPL